MDAALLAGQRNRAWSDTMVNLEARNLIQAANRVGSQHLRDGLSRIKFMQEIKGYIDQQFTLARKAKTDEECMLCIKNLRAERDSLIQQSTMLKTRAAQLYAQVEWVKQNDRIVGYVISAVKVVLSGFAIAGGVALAGTMTPIGMLVGATLVMDGVNGISREVNHQFLNKPESQGAVADGAMHAAEFMGFKAESGLAFYNTVSLAASVYSVFGLLRKPGAWRLFHYLPSDYYRKVSSMSMPKITMKMVGYGLKAKIIVDLIGEQEPQH
ncbi:DUF4225 domain-containing protein [Pantoea sp. Al-1710]|uniref:DUF4225 domain-containing protein n=1 Tax=Candidatus Pantoea communis TaxID=2608354 RepID=A0ABX0RHL5_9GAMM|nr:DUF4225 domain-containing protein [Pantoea communis]NIG17130.1 DUF4225 domain-containing protein [Pantoea communis]